MLFSLPIVSHKSPAKKIRERVSEYLGMWHSVTLYRRGRILDYVAGQLHNKSFRGLKGNIEVSYCNVRESLP